MDFDRADALNEAIRAIGTRHRALAIGALAPLGIHPGQKLLLQELERGPRTQAQLAVASGYEPPTITMSVRQLEAAGFVARTPSPTDGRATVVELTPTGRGLVERMKAAWTQVAEETLSGLDPHMAGQVFAVLDALAANLAVVDAPDVPRWPGQKGREDEPPVDGRSRVPSAE